MKPALALLAALALVCVLIAAIAEGAESAAPATCSVGPPPDALGLHPFYRKYCIASGIPVASSEHVPDAALQMAAEIASQMLSVMPAVRERLVDIQSRIAVIGAHQATSDIPEYKSLVPLYPNIDQRTRGIGAGTVAIPITSGAEENLLCYQIDRYRGQNIFLHEFSHTIKLLGIQSIDPSFGLKVQQAYDHAKAAGLWANTYSMANAEEYWAEGVQSYFDANKMVDRPNGIHNAIGTRAKLKEYDRDLFSLIDAAFKATAWRPRYPDLGLLPRPGCRLQSETYVVPSESGSERNVKVVRCLPVPTR